jgi:hypothetical protein
MLGLRGVKKNVFVVRAGLRKKIKNKKIVNLRTVVG